MLRRLLNNLPGRRIDASSRIGKFKEDALTHYEQAAQCIANGQIGAAESHYRAAIRSDPQSAALRYNLGLLLHGVGELTEAEACYRTALRLVPQDQAVQSSLLCIGDFSLALSRDEVFHRHRQWAQKYADPLTSKALPHTNATPSPRRLRIGYVSADFRQHVIGRFIEPVLGCHDRNRFEIYCYDNSGRAEDESSRRMRNLVPNWRHIAKIDDAEVAAIIRRDGVDLLIDLSGHSAGNRLLAFARKPAPIQLTWMGYLNTTGMVAMDYRISDAIADPIGTDRWYIENLVRLCGPQWCCIAPQELREIGSVVRRFNSGNVLFGSVARFMKLSDEVIALWIALLRSNTAAHLRIIDVPDHRRGDAIRHRFHEAGLGDRTDFMPTLTGADYWKCLEEIDIALDPFPYTGATTTCDCLWMGLPVITLAGSCGAARSATSLLHGLGLGHWTTTSAEDYIAAASVLANNREELRYVRSSLRTQLRRSSACDPMAFTRGLEGMFQVAWDKFRRGMLPEPISCARDDGK